MTGRTEHGVVFTARQRAELVAEPALDAPLEPDQVAGRTLVSLVSPGTELNGGFLGSRFPSRPGYAAVFEVEQVGSVVGDLKPGERVFCMGRHHSTQRHRRQDVLALPAGLTPQQAVFARLMGVSMTTLVTTRARPGDRVLVTGLGPVGNLAAQMFTLAGYQVIGCEPNESRRRLAESVNIRQVFPAVPVEDSLFAGSVALAVECSGHEQAALDCCRVVRRGGEVVLVGVPWRRRSDLPAFEVLHAVFHRYVVLRSGWEWEVPNHASDFRPHSIFGGFATALRWLAEGHIRVDPLCQAASPADCQRVYDDLLAQRGGRIVTTFDWTHLP